MAEHAWDVRIYADNQRWTFRASCTCGWLGQPHRQMYRGKTLESKEVPKALAAIEGLKHVRAFHESLA